jgi:hypothetical protein
MKDAEIGDRLRDRNHWWRDERGWEREDENLRERHRLRSTIAPESSMTSSQAAYTRSVVRAGSGKSLELRRAIAALIARGVAGRTASGSPVGLAGGYGPAG